MRIHFALGPGLLEGADEACLAREMAKSGREVKRLVPLPVIYDGVRLDVGHKLDLRVGGSVVLELKAVE